jgi:hypothetical protein
MATPLHCSAHNAVPMGGKLSRRRLEHQLTACMPATTVETLAAEPAGHAGAATAIGRTQAAARTTGDPARRLGGHREAMAHAHHKVLLRCIDGRHARAEVRPVHLVGLQDPVHPGMNHLVAERAERGVLGQGLQQRPRQHDLAEGPALTITSIPIKPSAAAHPAIAPAHRHQGGAIRPRQAPLKVLPIEPMEQGQQRNEGHADAPALGACSLPEITTQRAQQR